MFFYYFNKNVVKMFFVNSLIKKKTFSQHFLLKNVAKTLNTRLIMN
jgi:hypothetical protein